MKKFSLGFDLGGTKLAAALLSDDGTILEYTKIPVHMERDHSAKKTQSRIVQLMADIALDYKKRYPKECSASRFQGIGLASAGPLNAETGTLINPANYPGWKTVPIRQLVENKIRKSGFNTHVVFQNDAIAASLAEAWVGGAKKLESYCVVTVGTGIGSGVILNRRVCQSRGMGSEFGHMYLDLKPLRLAKGEVGPFSVEGLASGTALLKRAKARGFKGVSVEEIAAAGPKYAPLFEDMAQALAVLCFNLSIGFNLDKIFFSGGLIKIQKKFFPQTKIKYRKLIREFNSIYECPIEIAQTKNRAGVIGAGYLPYFTQSSKNR